MSAWKCSFGVWNCRECVRPSADVPRRAALFANRNTAYNAAVPADARQYLTVPFAEKNLAKRLGARWDNDKRQWYCDSREDNKRFATWGAIAVAKSKLVAVAVAPPVPVRKALFESKAKAVIAPTMEEQWNAAVAGDADAEEAYIAALADTTPMPRKAPIVPSMDELVAMSTDASPAPVAPPVAPMLTTDDLFAALAATETVTVVQTVTVAKHR